MPSLRAVAARDDLAGVVTQPDRPAGRGHRLKSTPVKAAAREMRLQVYEPSDLRAFAAQISDENFDLFVLASYGRILPQALLDLPKLGSLNVHPSLLPKYRGATPIQNAIANGDSETGVTIMLMDAGLDTGDVILQRRLLIEPHETYGTLHDRLAALGAELLDEALDRAGRGQLAGRAQSGDPSHTRPFAKRDLIVDLTLPPQRVVNLVRAFSPQPGARAVLDGELVKILRAHVTSDGELRIDELIAPNRGRMTGDQYLKMRRDRSVP